MKKLKTAIIGIGPHGKRLIEIVKKLEQLELTGLVDLNINTLSDYVEFNCYQNTVELYLEHQIDVVLISTNGPSHAKLATEAIEKGVKYVMVEKPMACSVADCREMEAKAKEFGVRLSVNKKNRLDPVIQYLKDYLDSEEAGKLRSIYLQIPGIGLGCLATHWIDVTNYLIGTPPISVTAWIDTPKGKNPRGENFIDPGGLIVLDYGNELRIVISQIEDGAGPMTMEIHATATRIFYDPKNNYLQILERDLDVKPGPGKPPVYKNKEIPESLNIKGDMLGQITEVIKELISDKTMITDAKFGTLAIEILSAAYTSSESGNIPIKMEALDELTINRFMPIT